MFALAARFDLLDPVAAQRFDALVAELLPQIAAKEPGTLVYSTHDVVDAPLSRLFYECYADHAAFEAHEAQPHTEHFLAERIALIADQRVEFLTPNGGTVA